MKHAREDYNRFQDPENKIPEDEPVFLIRGRDPIAPAVLRYYADMQRSRATRIMARGSMEMEDALDLACVVERHATAMEEWNPHGHKKRIADL